MRGCKERMQQRGTWHVILIKGRNSLSPHGIRRGYLNQRGCVLTKSFYVTLFILNRAMLILTFQCAMTKGPF